MKPLKTTDTEVAIDYRTSSLYHFGLLRFFRKSGRKSNPMITRHKNTAPLTATKITAGDMSGMMFSTETGKQNERKRPLSRLLLLLLLLLLFTSRSITPLPDTYIGQAKALGLRVPGWK